MQKITILLLLLAAGLIASAQTDLKKYTIEQYIDKFAPLAQNEMSLYGIPASITLAQGILESNYGNSELTRNARNHFGIKCHSGWTGKGYYMDDDAKNECFRVYDTDSESYRDHSDFLKNRERYAFLFELDATDYKSWAKGLQRAGYATNPQYANLLIRIIEDRNLTRFDTKKQVDVTKDYSDPDKVIEQLPDQIYLFNNIKTVLVKPGQNLQNIADAYHMNLRQLTRYNDMEEDVVLQTGQKIYLQPKRSKGFEKLHEVKQGEDMRFISQKQGIKLTTLYKKNHMVPGEEPLPGERLCLQRKCKEKPKTRNEEELLEEKKKELDKHISQVKKDTKKVYADSMAIVRENEKAAAANAPKGPPYYHTVAAGETMYSISKKYGAAIADIEMWNKLGTGPKLSVGQKLIVGYGDVKPIEPPKMPEPINPQIFGADSSKYKPANPPVTEQPTTPEEIEEEPADPTEEEPVVVTEAELDPSVPEKQPDEPENPMAYPEYHVVAAGESMYGIAKQYGITVEQLREWNNLPDYNVSVGNKLVVYDNTTAPGDIVPLEKEIENNKRYEEAIYHTVVAGETLYGVARLYQVSVNDIKKWNPGMNEMLKTGQKLVIAKVNKPSPPDEADVPKPKQPTLPKPAPAETPKSTETKYHTVEPGQTLYAISRLYNVTVEQITKWNNLSTTSINVGQKLIVSP
jgi:LysM repeat protein